MSMVNNLSILPSWSTVHSGYIIDIEQTHVLPLDLWLNRPDRFPMKALCRRVPAESGKPGKWKWSWKSHGTWNFVIQSWNFTNFAPNLYFLNYHWEIVCIFWHFPRNVANSKSGREMFMDNKKNGHGKVMERYFVKSVGTLISCTS